MPDIYTNNVDRIKIRYGQGGYFDHQSEYLVSNAATYGYSVMDYTGPAVTPGYDPVTNESLPETVVDYANALARGLRTLTDLNVYIEGIVIEELNSDLEVVAIKPCSVVAAINTFPNPEAAGLRGQYLLFQGYNAAGYTSKRMIAGVSGLYNGYGDSLVADIGASGDDPHFNIADYLNRLQSLPVAGKAIQQWGLTSQFDVDNELAPIVAGFGSVVLHGQNKRWRKRFSY